jgi:hypothetical protein
MTIQIIFGVWVFMSIYTAYWLYVEFEFSKRLAITIGFMLSSALFWIAVATKIMKK